jgi:N-succinyldiaminopimelate aminotransferase
VNRRVDLLHPYPFERLRLLMAEVAPPAGLTPINLGAGEPQHPTPDVITRAIVENLTLLGKYPPTPGTPALRQAISEWLGRRYGIPPLDPDRAIVPVSGSREALFAFAQAVVDPAGGAAVLLPNPFYQIYEGAALLAGAEPVYVPTPASNGYMPDWKAVPGDVWPRAQLVYVCSPGNPSGAILGLEEWRELFELADRYGFIVAADECYSEIYNAEPPVGVLQAAHTFGRGYERLVSINSLSKRSSAPGLRSGFVAGDPEIIAKFVLYRTYHGAAPSLLTQAASVAAWSDEVHVEENRQKYRAKFEDAQQILGVEMPKGSFFLWYPCRDDETFARRLHHEAGLTIVPGTYLGRPVNGHNPGANHARIALVPEGDVCREALTRIRALGND